MWWSRSLLQAHTTLLFTLDFNMKFDKFYKYFLVYIFIFLVIFIPLEGLINYKTIDNRENRTLNNFPNFKETEFKAYFNEISKYFDDHFGVRKLFMRIYRIINKKFIKDSNIKEGTVGLDNFYFYSQELDFYEGKNCKNNNFDNLKSFIKNYNQDIAIIFVIIPTKAQILPDLLPSQIRKSSKRREVIDNLTKLNSGNKFAILDLLEPLKIENSKQIIYRKFDTHFNDYGAYYSYQEIIKFINKNYQKNIKILPILSTKIQKNVSGDFAKMMNRDDLIEDIVNIDIENKSHKINKVYSGKKYADFETDDYFNESNNIDLIIFHDSFLNTGLGRFLSSSFRNIWNFWNYKIDSEIFYDIIKKNQPDFVIIEIADRHLCS